MTKPIREPARLELGEKAILQAEDLDGILTRAKKHWSFATHEEGPFSADCR